MKYFIFILLFLSSIGFSQILETKYGTILDMYNGLKNTRLKYNLTFETLKFKDANTFEEKISKLNKEFENIINAKKETSKKL